MPDVQTVADDTTEECYEVKSEDGSVTWLKGSDLVLDPQGNEVTLSSYNIYMEGQT